MTDRELIERAKDSRRLVHLGGPIRSVRGAQIVLQAKEMDRLLAMAERGAALEGATEAWITTSLSTLTDSKGAVTLSHEQPDSWQPSAITVRRVLILRPESIAGAE